MKKQDPGNHQEPETDDNESEAIESALEQERYLMAALMDNVPDHIYFKDLESRFIRNNLAHAASFGFNDPSVLVGKSDFDFFHEDVARQQFNDEQEIIRTGLSLTKEERTIRSDGSVNWYLTTKMPLRDKYGKIVGTFGISRDMTRRKETEHELRKLSMAVEQSPVSIVITNPDGDIEYANPKACQTTGYDLRELLGKNPRVLKSGEKSPEEYASLWQSITAGSEWKGLFHNKKKNGELYWEASTIAPIKDSGGNITHFLAVKEDITANIEAEKMIRQQNEELIKINAEKDKFFSIIAHDLRSPFSSFLNLTRIMAEEVQDINPEKIRQLSASINKSAGALYALLENLLAWSMMKRGLADCNPERVSLKEMVTGIVNISAGMAANKLIDVNIIIPQDLEVLADKQMLEATLRNLVTNAIKFSNKGGILVITAKKEADGKFVMVSVRDTGIGMSNKILSGLFRIDEQVSRKGTAGESSSGLGLLLCKEFVEKQGGTIQAESQEKNGSIFRFTIPLWP